MAASTHNAALFAPNPQYGPHTPLTTPSVPAVPSHPPSGQPKPQPDLHSVPPPVQPPHTRHPFYPQWLSPSPITTKKRTTRCILRNMLVLEKSTVEAKWTMIGPTRTTSLTRTNHFISFLRMAQAHGLRIALGCGRGLSSSEIDVGV